MSLRVPGADASWASGGRGDEPRRHGRSDPPTGSGAPARLSRLDAVEAAVAGILGGVGLLSGLGAMAVVGAWSLLLALGWAVLALLGLALGGSAIGLAAALHGARSAWRISRPYRLAGQAGGLRAGQVAVGSAQRALQAAGQVAVRSTRWVVQAAPHLAEASAGWMETRVRGLSAWPGRTTRRAAVVLHQVRLRGPLVLLGLIALLVVAAAGLAVPARAALGIVATAVQARSAPLTLPPLTQGSTVYGTNGTVVAVLHADDNRQPIPLSAVSPLLINAVVDTEDSRFWHHGGVDLRSLLRAVRTDVGAGAARQGASTIAEQLVKNTLLANAPDHLRRKVQEAVMANRLESRIGKRALLAEYLNTIYLGEGSYGVQAAAETYFARPASDLDPAQAALLAGLIQDPNGYDPIRQAPDARARRATVLGLMVSAHHLSGSAARRFNAEPLPSSVHRAPEGRNYFVEAVKQELLADPRLGPTPGDRYRALFYGGLRVHTTLDPVLQAQASRAVTAGLPSSRLHLSAALAAVDPGTGAVRAVVGGPSFQASQFDVALASPGRQTGSAFKVFTLVAALEQGYSPVDMIDGSGPCRIPDPGGTPDPWVLSNYESENFGTIDLTTATAKSVNCAYARLALMVGLPHIAQVAKAMGITAPLAVVPSMTLGTNDVPPLQMASAYATLAADGVYRRPHLVSEVDRPDGRPLFHNEAGGVRVMSAQVARETTAVLTHVVTEGTGTAAALAGRSVAGKTGTTAHYQDAWFDGYTAGLATAVWMGDPAGEVPMLDVGGVNVAGGTYPAQIWHSFMAAATTGEAPGAFPSPDPAQTPSPVYLRSGRPRAGAPTSAPGPSTRTTTWCMSSCGR